MDFVHTLVLVSNDETLIDASQDSLRDADEYRVVICDNEKDALIRLDSMEVHLLIYDISMLRDRESNVLISARVSHPHISRVLVCNVENVQLGSELARSAAAY